MEFTANRKDFIDALLIGGSMSGKNKTEEVLDNSRIVIKNNKLIVSSYDGEVYVKKRISLIDSSEDISFCIDSYNTIKYLKSLKEESLKFVICDMMIHINHEKGVMECPIFDCENFPEIEKQEDIKKYQIPSDILSEWISNSRLFVASDQLRPAMNGMYIYFEDNYTGVCATDAQKLYTDSIQCNNESGECSAIVLSKSLPVIVNAIYNTETTSISIDSKNIYFNAVDTKVICRLIEQRYPRFQSVIPRDNTIKIKINIEEVSGMINRVKMFANASSLIKISADSENLTFESSDTDFNKKSVEKCNIEKTGNDITIGVNGEKMQQCLTTIASETAILSMSAMDRPIILQEEERPNKVVLLMPMSL